MSVPGVCGSYEGKRRKTMRRRKRSDGGGVCSVRCVDDYADGSSCVIYGQWEGGETGSDAQCGRFTA